MHKICEMRKYLKKQAKREFYFVHLPITENNMQNFNMDIKAYAIICYCYIANKQMSKMSKVLVIVLQAHTV